MTRRSYNIVWVQIHVTHKGFFAKTKSSAALPHRLFRRHSLRIWIITKSNVNDNFPKSEVDSGSPHSQDQASDSLHTYMRA